MSTGSRAVQLMNRNRISRSLKRISLEILEDVGGVEQLYLAGIKQRGVLVAQKLRACIAAIEGENIPIWVFGESVKPPKNKQIWTRESHVIVVDDVIFSGKTMFHALKKITDLEMPKSIKTAVLIDRGHRKFPIHATYKGMHIPTKVNEHITVECSKGHLQQVILTNK